MYSLLRGYIYELGNSLESKSNISEIISLKKDIDTRKKSIPLNFTSIDECI